ncbi:hypothetical protein E2C01_035536 [Portunus trituberculatus]|uniref:Uncharacterized protein n=1 Tax=Portunus trituberculatus TaxID=210409 RepID=A0A5B7F8L3_PORTR|nr:hypothetical protein [Portunus trituberculatus]
MTSSCRKQSKTTTQNIRGAQNQVNGAPVAPRRRQHTRKLTTERGLRKMNQRGESKHVPLLSSDRHLLLPGRSAQTQGFLALTKQPFHGKLEKYCLRVRQLVTIRALPWGTGADHRERREGWRREL